MLRWFAERLRGMQEAGRDERGFTLIELLVVMIIIGILAAIAIPAYLSQRDNAQQKAAQANVREAATAEQAHYAQNGSYTNAIADLNTQGFRQGSPTVTIASSSGGASYCVSATGGGQAYHMDQTTGAPATGGC